MNTLKKTQQIFQVALLATITSLGLVACSADDPGTGVAATGSSSGDPRTGPVTGTDSDGDGTPNATDNCPGIANPAQGDLNRNGIGDACEDSDGDGLKDVADNCPLISNAGQADSNRDGIGDACSADFDGDGVADVAVGATAADNCPTVANAAQTDTDGDGIGDACDTATATDTDGDGKPNVASGGTAADNCPLAYNPNQQDTNGNGVGDVCDAPIKDVCGAGFRPLLEPEVMAYNSPTSSLLGIPLSQVSNISAVTDTNADNYASLSLTADALGLLGTAYSGVRSILPQPAGHQVGFLISGAPSLLNVTALTGVSVQTLSGSAVVESFTDGTTLSVSLLAGSADKGLLKLTPTKPFDGLRINIGGAANVLSSLRVHAACTAL
ncbi:MAG TPA: thrombospondin type 3 repeat-containing protein [Moraxellaceae bacterium]